MTPGSSTELRQHLVERLARAGYLSDPRVAAAFRTIPREIFLPWHAVRYGTASVYRDEAIVVRRDLTSGAPRSSSSQPTIMAVMLQMLDLRPGQRVLEIGAGTGYNAALLDRLTRPDGLVITADVDRDVAAGAAAALGRAGSRAQVVVADGRASPPIHLPFDRMMVTASSAGIPRTWHDCLGPQGRLVVPLRLSTRPDSPHAIAALARTGPGFDSVAVTGGGFMPLRGPVDHPSGAPEAAPVDERQPAGLDIPRDMVGHLRIAVRYTAGPPDTRWHLRLADHWIGIDVDPRYGSPPGDDPGDTGADRPGPPR